MDYSLAEALNDLALRSRVIEAVAEFFAQDGVLIVLAIVALLFFARGRWASPAGRAAASSAGFSAVLALGLGQLLSTAVDRSRPFVTHPDIHLLIRHARDAGFPSDHATGSFAIAVAVLLRHRRAGWLALALATVVAVSRVLVGAHYPGDVLAGALLGAGVALILWLPPTRRLTDRIARAAGSAYDRLTPPLGSRVVRVGWR